MASEANKLQVGIFVIIAGAIALGSAIWLGATSFLEETETFVTYFSESVQGLDPGSPVKYRGVPAGRVGDINIAPDGELIEVVMDIDSEMATFLRHDASLRAKLELAGITGLRYVEIEPRSGEMLAQAPILRFKPKHDVIPSAKSSFQAVQKALGDAYDQIMRIDTGGISDDIRDALQAANQLMHDPRIGRVLDNLSETTEASTKVANNLERLTADLDLGPMVANATEATAEAKSLFTTLDNVTQEEIASAARELASLAQSAQTIVSGLQYTLDRLDRTVGSLREFTEEVRAQPSLLFFSEPPPGRRDRQERR